MSEGLLSVLLCVHIVDMGTLDLHALILNVSEGFLSKLLCNHIVDMGTFYLHGLILCVSEDFLSQWLCIHIVDTDVFLEPYRKCLRQSLLYLIILYFFTVMLLYLLLRQPSRVDVYNKITSVKDQYLNDTV